MPPSPRPSIITRLRHLLAHTGVRAGLLLLWLGVVVYLMVSPKGEGTPVTELSVLFGDSDFTDALGHVFLYGMLTLMIWAVLKQIVDAQWAWWVAGAIGLGLGIGLETYQGIIGRGNSLLDYSANVIGAMGALAIAWWFSRRTAKRPL